jgi:hypothetical protein
MHSLDLAAVLKLGAGVVAEAALPVVQGKGAEAARAARFAGLPFARGGAARDHARVLWHEAEGIAGDGLESEVESSLLDPASTPPLLNEEKRRG